MGGPRAPEVQKLVDQLRAPLPPKDDPTFQEKNKEVITILTEKYQHDESLWLYVYQSFMNEVLSLLRK